MKDLDVIQQAQLKNWIVQRILSLSVEVLGAVKQSNSEQKVLELSQKAADDLYEKFINIKN